MAAITANAVSANWNTNGAWSGGVQPTAADTVTIPSGANITVPAATTVVARSVTVQSGGTLTWASSATAELDVGDSGGGAFTCAGTIALGATLGVLKFVSTQAATLALTSGGQQLPNTTISGGASTTIQLTDAFTTAGTITLTQAKLDTNSQSVSCSTFILTGSATRSLTLGTSAITCTFAGAGPWDAGTSGTVTGLTFSGASSTITLSGATGSFRPGATSLTYGTVNLTGSGNMQVSGAATFTNLNRTGTAAKTDVLQLTGAVTVSGTLTLAGNSATNRLVVQSNTLGTARTLTVNTTVTASNVDFQDITGAGTASWNLAAITGLSGDALGNSGITFTTGASQFWRGNGGNWSDVNHWASTSGGAAASGRVPLPQDNAVFDANSFSSASQGVVMDMPRAGANFTTTGVTNTPSLNTGAINITWYGNLTISSAVSRNTWSNSWGYQGRGAQTITTGTFSVPAMLVQSIGGSYTLQDAYSAATQAVTVASGTFNANGQAVTAFGFASTGSVTRAVTLGSGAWTLAGTSTTVWNTASSGLTLTVTGSLVQFTGTSGTPTITTGGVTLGPITFNGAGGSWTLNDSLTMGSSSGITLTAGTLNTNNQTVTCASFSSSNSNTRTLTMGSSSITVAGSGVVWSRATSTNMTVTANTAIVTVSGSNAQVNAGDATSNWNGMSLVFTGSGVATIANSGTTTTFANVTRTGTAAKTDTFGVSGNIICTGTFTVTGNSTTNRVLVQALATTVSVSPGTTRTVTAATTVLTNVDFMDIAAAGAAAWTGTSLGDALGNSGITFTVATTVYWVGGTGGMSGLAHWASSSGGAASSGRVPLPQDTVIFDANSFSAGSQTVTSDMPRSGADINFTGVTNTPTLNGGFAFYGNLTLVAGMTLVQGTIAWFASGRGSQTITSAGQTFQNTMSINAPNGTYALVDAFSTTLTVLVNNGGFDTASQAFTAVSYSAQGTNVRTLSFGTSTVTLTGGAGSTVFGSSGTNVSNSGSATFVMAGVSTGATGRTFAGSGQTYGALVYTVAGSQGPLLITGANTFASISIGSGRTLTLPSSTTTTVTGSLSLAGTANVGYLYLGGQVGQYVSTPSQAVHNINGDLDLRWFGTLDNWTPTSTGVLVAKYNTTTNQRSYELYVDTSGRPNFAASWDGVNSTTVTATASVASVGAVAGSPFGVRATLVLSTRVVTFYTSTDGVTWTTLGSTGLASASLTSLFTSTTPLEVGSNAIGTANLAVGQFQWAEVRSGINGTVVARFDASVFASPWRYYSPTANLLDKDSSDLEGSVGGWAAGTGAPTVTRDATVSAEGSASLKMVSTAAGSNVIGISGSNFNATTAIPVIPGAPVSFLASVKGVAANLLVSWTDASGASLSSPTVVAFGAAGAFTNVVGTITAPATAAWAVPKFSWTAAAAGEVLNADKIGFYSGTVAAGAWTAGSVPWRVNGYTTNAGVPFGQAAINASTAGTAATLSAGSGVTVSATDLTVTDSTATGGAGFYVTPSLLRLSNTSGWFQRTTVTAADTAGATDGVATVKLGVRSGSDAAGATDAARPAFSGVRAGADSAAATDAPALTGLVGRAGGDVAAVADVASRTFTGARTASDAAPAADAASRLLAAGRSATDAAAATDAGQRAVVGLIAVTDHAAAADAATRLAQVSTRATADTAHSTDAATRTRALTRVTTDTAHAADAAGRHQAQARTTADVTSATDAAVRHLTVQRRGSDAAGAADAATRTAQTRNRTAADAAAATDAATRAQHAGRTTADTAHATDAATRMVPKSRTAHDAAPAVDAAAAQRLSATRTAADAAGAADSAQRAARHPRAANDAAPAADAAARQQARSRTAADTAHATDAATGHAHRSRTAADVANASDAAVRHELAARAATDAAHALDAALASRQASRTAADVANASDAATVRFRLRRAGTDSATATDAATRGVLAQARAVIDAAAAADLADWTLVTTGRGLLDVTAGEPRSAWRADPPEAAWAAASPRAAWAAGTVKT